MIITGANGGVFNRLEINDFLEQHQQFSLYIQAIERIQNLPQYDITSFFQISGIHGMPYISWGESETGATNGGYCTHGSVLFPTWHRVHLMLFEQVLQDHAKVIASTYTVDRNVWMQAAMELRQPYWDWAYNSLLPLEMVLADTVTITTPDGQATEVPNPLLRYKFNPIHEKFLPPYNKWPKTLRHPDKTHPAATDNVTRLRIVLKSAQSDITTKTFNMLTRVHDWRGFSNHTIGNSNRNSNSLESIHDDIHDYVGGNGHMGDTAVAAFDPIFYMHHTNVDRLLSLWSALNPGVWVAADDAEDDSFILLTEPTANIRTALTPFRNGPKSYWTSENLEDTSLLGYSYPEFNGLDSVDAEELKLYVRRIVERIYGDPILEELQRAKTTFPKALTWATLSPSIDIAPRPESFKAQRSVSFWPHSSIGGLPPSASTLAKASEWTARIRFKKYELGCSFLVILLLGEASEDPEEWLISPNFVGAHSAFVNSASMRCENCRQQVDTISEGFVHLNIGLARHLGIYSSIPEVVISYLLNNLKWRVLKADGTQAELRSLDICVRDTFVGDSW